MQLTTLRRRVLQRAARRPAPRVVSGQICRSIESELLHARLDSAFFLVHWPEHDERAAETRFLRVRRGRVEPFDPTEPEAWQGLMEDEGIELAGDQIRAACPTGRRGAEPASSARAHRPKASPNRADSPAFSGVVPGQNSPTLHPRFPWDSLLGNDNDQAMGDLAKALGVFVGLLDDIDFRDARARGMSLSFGFEDRAAEVSTTCTGDAGSQKLRFRVKMSFRDGKPVSVWSDGLPDEKR